LRLTVRRPLFEYEAIDQRCTPFRSLRRRQRITNRTKKIFSWIRATTRTSTSIEHHPKHEPYLRMSRCHRSFSRPNTSSGDEVPDPWLRPPRAGLPPGACWDRWTGHSESQSVGHQFLAVSRPTEDARRRFLANLTGGAREDRFARPSLLASYAGIWCF